MTTTTLSFYRPNVVHIGGQAARSVFHQPGWFYLGLVTLGAAAVMIKGLQRLEARIHQSGYLSHGAGYPGCHRVESLFVGFTSNQNC